MGCNSYGASGVKEVTYTITSGGGGQVATPTILPASGQYPSPQSITMSTATSGAAIHYIVGTTPPSCYSSLYNGAISVTIPNTVKAIACKTGMTDSSIATNTYTLTGGGSPPAAPTFNPTTKTSTAVSYTHLTLPTIYSV